MREALRVSWILLRYKWLQNVARMRLGRKKKGATQRQATAPKPRAGTLGFGVLYVLMLLSMSSSHRQLLRALTDGSALESLAKSVTIPEILLTASPVWDRLPELYWLGLGLGLMGIAFGILLIPLARVGHATQDSELEWISTFPVNPRSFFFGRILQTAAMNTFTWLFLIPFCLVFVLMRGHAGSLSLLGMVVFGLTMSVGSCSFGQVLDAWVQTRLSPARQRDVRALVVVLSLLAMTQFYIVHIEVDGYWRFVIAHFENLQASPWFFVLNRVFASAGPDVWMLLALVVGTAFLVWVSTWLQTRIYGQGLVAHSGYERHTSLVKAKRPRLAETWISRIPVMMRRELQLLQRDRTHLTQVLISPLVFIGFSFMSRHDGSKGLMLSVIAMVPMMMIMTASAAMIQKEQTALWQYAVVPRPLVDVLGDRQKFWAYLAFGFFALASAIALPRTADWGVWVRWLLIPVAMGIYQNLSLSLVMFLQEPFSQDPVPRASMRLSYLLLGIAGILVVTVTQGQPWTILVTLTLMGGVMLACRQRLRDHEPFILDPSLSPPAEASLGDGLTAALMYFVLQSVLMLVFFLFSRNPETSILWASLIGAVVTFAVMQGHYHRRQAMGVPVYFGAMKASDVVLLLVFLGGLVGFASVWLKVAPHWDIWNWLLDQAKILEDRQIVTKKPSMALILFVSLVAPLIEEYIFRGLIFGGMRRRFGLLSSLLASSLIFAFLHPPLSFGPVFLVGIATAVLYERTQKLIPGVLLHVMYNICILVLSAW